MWWTWEKNEYSLARGLLNLQGSVYCCVINSLKAFDMADGTLV